jgi:nucleoid DNA-binding protein
MRAKRKRDAAKDPNLCVVGSCKRKKRRGKNPHTGKRYATCEACNEAAKERVARSRFA